MDDHALIRRQSRLRKSMTTRNKGSKSKRSRPSSGFTASELRTLRALKTPAGIQKFLDDLPYNLSYDARSPKKILHDRGHLHAGHEDEAATERAAARFSLKGR